MSIEIEDNIPLPELKIGTTGMRDALKKMKVGQSIFIAGKTTKNVSGPVGAIMGAGNMVCRTLDGGVRIWRVK